MEKSISTVELRAMARDNEGFLLEPSEWNREVALAIASECKQALSDEHWQVIHFIRERYETTQVVPEARKLLRFMKEALGSDRGTRRYLYQLFPTGYGQTACKIAGMRKPLKLMLDV